MKEYMPPHLNSSNITSVNFSLLELQFNAGSEKRVMNSSGCTLSSPVTVSPKHMCNKFTSECVSHDRFQAIPVDNISVLNGPKEGLHPSLGLSHIPCKASAHDFPKPSPMYFDFIYPMTITWQCRGTPSILGITTRGCQKLEKLV